MKELQIFNNGYFGQVRTISIEGKIYFVASDVAKALKYKNVNDAILRHCRWVVKHDIPHPQSKDKTIEVNVIPEGDIYRLVSNSELPSAERFESWIFDEVLPTIRKTGGYVNNDELFINTYLPNADDATKTMLKAQLAVIKNLNNVIEYKNEVIKGVTEDIDIYTKRNVLNKVVRYKGANFSERWNELYDRFKEVYSIDLKARCEGHNLKQAKDKDKLSIVKYAEKFGHLDNLYKVALKLYETDIKEILNKLEKIA